MFASNHPSRKALRQSLYTLMQFLFLGILITACDTVSNDTSTKFPTKISSIALAGHNWLVLCTAWSPDGKIIASASDDKTVGLWSSEGKALLKLEGPKANVETASWSPDGRRIASGSWDHKVWLWKIGN